MEKDIDDKYIKTYLRFDGQPKLVPTDFDFLRRVARDKNGGTVPLTSLRMFHLINSPGGWVETADVITRATARIDRRGGETYAFSTWEAASAAAQILVSAKKRYVLRDTRIMFHLASKEGASDDNDLEDENNEEWVSCDELDIELMGMVHEIVSAGRISSLRARLSSICAKTLDSKTHPPTAFSYNAVNKREYDSDIVFTGSKAESLGLVRKAYASIGGIRNRLDSLLGSAANEKPISSFLASW